MRDLPNRLKAVATMKAFEIYHTIDEERKMAFCVRGIIEDMLRHLDDEDLEEMSEELPAELLQLAIDKINEQEEIPELMN